MLSIPRSKNKEENKTLGNNYEKIARDFTLEGTQDGDEEEGRKIGDNVADENKDLRYDIDAILENSICPQFDKHRLYNWYTARFYSVIDVKGHPMLKPAKAVLERHLKRLQQIEKEQMEQMAGPDDNDDDTEGEESEDDSEDEEDVPGTNYGITASHALPKPSGSSPGTHGPFKYGNSLPTKEQFLEQYEKVKMFRAKQFEEMEKALDNEEDKQNLNKERIVFFKQLEYQRDQQLNNLNSMIQESKQGRASIPSQEDEEAFKIDDEEDDGEEEEEEEEAEESQEVDHDNKSEEPQQQFNNQPNLIDVDDINRNEYNDNQYENEDIDNENNPEEYDEQEENDQEEEEQEKEGKDNKNKHDDEILNQLYGSSDDDKNEDSSDPEESKDDAPKEEAPKEESDN